MTEPCHDLAHLAHVEMLTDRFEESLDFFTRVYGLKLSGRDDTSAYLRAWDEYEFHSLKLTRSPTTGVGHVAYRADSPEALERRVQAIEASGYQDPRLGRRRPRPRAGLPLRGSLRPRLRDLLGHRALPCRGRRPAGAEEPRQPLSRPGRLAPPDRPREPARRGRRRLPRLGRDLPRRPRHRDDRARQRPARRRLVQRQQQDLRPRLHRGARRAATAGCTTSPTPPTSARTSCAPPTSSSRTASTSRPARTSTRSRAASFSTSGSRRATAWSSPTPAPG